MAHVGTVAYRLQLPPSAKIHPVFHISLLNKYVGPSLPALGTVPDMDEFGVIATEPMAILARKLGKTGNKVVVYLLIQWSNKPKEEATWELYTNIEAKFPSFNLEA